MLRDAAVFMSDVQIDALVSGRPYCSRLMHLPPLVGVTRSSRKLSDNLWNGKDLFCRCYDGVSCAGKKEKPADA